MPPALDRRGLVAAEAARLAVDVLELELEAATLDLDVRDGLAPPWARRPLLEHERRARVMFAALAADVDDTVATVNRRQLAARVAIRDELAAALEELADTPAIARYLADLADPAVPLDLGATVTADLETAIRADYTATAEAAGGRVVEEAAAQGAARALSAVDVVAAAVDDAADVIALAARRAAAAPADAVRRVAAGFAERRPLSAMLPADARAGVLAEVDRASDAGILDAGRRGANRAAGHVRIGVAARATTPPAQQYASELLDAATCGPCSLVDGREYPTLDRAHADYPEGFYRSCEGGDRCRGTLVYVWEGETPPTDGVPANPPPPDDDPRPVTGPPAPAPPPRRSVEQDLAAELDVDVPTVRELREELRQVRAAARLEAAETAEAARADLERLDAETIKAPPRAVVRRTGVGRGAAQVRREGAGGEWDWLEQVHPDELKRLRRRYFTDDDLAEPPDSVFPRVAARDLQVAGQTVEGFEAGQAEWLELTRRRDAAGAVARGRLPARDAYGPTFDPNDLTPTLLGDGYRIEDLFGDEVTGLRHVREVRLQQEELYAERHAADVARRADVVDVTRLAPEDLTAGEFEAQVLDTFRRIDAGDAAAEARLLELVPDEFATYADDLTFDQLHALIVETRRGGARAAGDGLDF